MSDLLVRAMCEGATPEEAREVLEALQEAFDERVREVQYHPYDEARAARLEATRSILDRMERAAAAAEVPEAVLVSQWCAAPLMGDPRCTCIVDGEHIVRVTVKS